MSFKDDLISKRLTPGTGAIGIKGIKPVHPREHVCTKTLTKMGRTRYICPPSGGKQAVRSLENLPFKPEDVPEKLQEISALAPEQKFTPKQQREEPEKIHEALLKKPRTLHYIDHPEAGPDNVQDNLHFKEPKEAGPDNVQDNLHFKEPKEAKEKKKKKKDEKEEDVSKTLFLDSSVYFKKSFPSLDDIRNQLSKGAPGASMGARKGGPLKDGDIKRYGVETKPGGEPKRVRGGVSSVTEGTDPVDDPAIWGRGGASGLGVIGTRAAQAAEWVIPGGAGASITGKLTPGSFKIISALIKEHGLKFTKVAAGAARTPVMVAMLSLPGPIGRKIVQGAGAASRSKYALTASSEAIAKEASKALAPQAKNLITVAQKAAPTAAKAATTATKAAPTAAKKTAEVATKASAKAKIAATAAAASATKAATTAATKAEAPAPTPGEPPSAVGEPTSTAGEPAPTSKPSKGRRGKLLPFLAASAFTSEESPKRGRRGITSTTKQASQQGSKSRRARIAKDRAIAAALAAAAKEQKTTEAKGRGGAYSTTEGRRKKLSELQERSERLGGAPKQKATKTRDLFASLSASHSGQYFEKSAAFVAPYARQVMNKKMSLTAALDKVPWWMQDELLEYLRSKKKKR